MQDVKTATITSLITLFVLGVMSIFIAPNAQSDEGLLKVVFLDVGQGDATLIESPTGTQVLVDGGKDGMVLGALQKELGYFDRDLDMVVATHPDADHIGGLIDVLEYFEVDTILITENDNDSPVRDSFLEAVEAEGAQVRYARSGQAYALGGSTTLSILFPDIDPTSLESNLSSIIAQLKYGEIEYMLTGDSPKSIEEYLVEKGTELESEVLKVGHHGSKTSTAETFVSAVRPLYGIISAGKDNSYGHPHKEVTDLLENQGVTQKNTADEGSISSFSDGESVWFK